MNLNAPPTPLDPHAIPLHGAHLVEASAGTGKTHTIGTLYLRLVIERGLTVDQILVVTFTNAATAELRDRIRARTRKALDAFLAAARGRSVADPDSAPLVERWTASGGDPALAIARLTVALREIDTAAIFTIHSFCQRMLRDHAFDSGVPFEGAEMTDEKALLREVAGDFWTSATYAAPEAFIRHLSARSFSFETLRSFADRVMRTPDLRVVKGRTGNAGAAGAEDVEVAEDAEHAAGRGDVDRNGAHGWCGPAIDAAAADRQTAFDAAAAIWAASRGEVESLLCDRPGLNRGSYNPERIRTRWFTKLDAAVAARQPRHVIREKFWERLTPDGLAAKVNKGHEAPVHPFFDACQVVTDAESTLSGMLDAALLDFQAQAAVIIRRDLDRRKADANAMGYGDLLVRLDRALAPEAGSRAEHLAAQLRARFPAALIDEFQDTDTLQYRIFRRVFGPGAPDSTALYLIGDPKQAIYAFRGADVFAYLGAVRDTPPERRWTLVQNWRSDPGLIEAVNTLFAPARVARPFVFREIPFHSARPRDGATTGLRSWGGDGIAPFEILLATPAGDDDHFTVEDANREIPRHVAAEIRRLLAAGVEIADPAAQSTPDPSAGPTARDHAPPAFRRIEPGDIAVLVRTNDQADAVQRALRRLGVPSVLHSNASVLDTADAADVERVLDAMARPADGGVLRAALATALVGCTARDLALLQADESAWEARAGRFQAWNEIWRRQGFVQAFRRFLDDEGVAERLLSLQDGERRMTNVLHIGELLHAAAVKDRLDLPALWQWYRRVRHDPAARADRVGDASLLRLESDARAVQIATVHKAKGLEYPIVYCPFLWSSGELRSDGKRWPTYHDRAHGDRLTLSLAGKEDTNATERARREAFAEDLRLLYVAVTRARHRCSVVWGPIKGADASALGYLLHPAGEAGAFVDADSDALRDEAAAHVKAIIGAGDEAIEDALRRGLVAAAGGTIRLAPLSHDHAPAWRSAVEAGGDLSARAFTAAVDRGWRAASFSSLTQARSTSASLDAVRHDAADLADAAAEADAGADDSGRDHDAEAATTADGVEDVDDVGAMIDDGARARVDIALPMAAKAETAAPQPVPLHAFPAGPAAGNAVHGVLEAIDFRNPDADPAPLAVQVARQLRRHGIDPVAWADVLARAMRDVLDTPLFDGRDAFGLGDIPRSDRMVELEFTLPVVSDAAMPVPLSPSPSSPPASAPPPVARLTPRRLADAMDRDVGPGFPAGYAERVRDLGFADLAGYLRGYIDLVFRRGGRWYLVDYKSNHLGPTFDHYAPQRLAAAMAHHDYVLQYHLYVVALHRYLRQRLGTAWDYERDFGGVLYLFVRGLHPDHGPRRGVFFDRPTEVLVDRLSVLMDDPSAGSGSPAPGSTSRPEIPSPAGERRR